jgi:hypothetical protein
MELEPSSAIEAIEEALGSAARESFEEGVEELSYYTRSLALVGLTIPEEMVRGTLRRMCLGLVVGSVRASIESRLGREVTVGVSSGVICGKEMHATPEFMVINDKKDEIIDDLMKFVMDIFVRGRRLGRQIVRRALPLGRRPALSKKSPLEAIEIEIMRLEDKLPNISKIEALRLTDCYQMAERR